MIINWKKPKAGVKVIPLMTDDGRIEKNITVLPGHNEISAADWNKARKHEQIADYIKRGYFEEIGEVKEVEIEVPVKDSKGNTNLEKKKSEVIEEIKLKDLDAEKALEVVNDTYTIGTLEAWRKDESRDEIRAAIANQIENINKGGK